MRVLIVGCGYLGLRAAKRWIEAGVKVSALTRSASRAEEWESLGIQAVVGDVLDRKSLESLPEADLCLYAVGFDRSQPASKEQVYVSGLAQVLEVLKVRCPRVLYISSTSVYGQDHGEWVNEESPCLPESEGGRICLLAEGLVREFVQESPNERSAILMRLAGIYGPGRMLARREQLIQQRPLTGNPAAWLNLIHVEDAVEAALVLGEKWPTSPLTTWLLSDEEPVPRREFYQYLASLYGAPAPLFLEDDPGLNKRCDSRRCREALGLRLKYPSYREGLRMNER